MKIAPLCPMGPILMVSGNLIDGVEPGQHQWVDGQSWDGPGPELDVVRWHEAVCEVCGNIDTRWTRLQGPI